MAHDPAPFQLSLVEALCNSATHLWGTDQLSTIGGANHWLRQNGYSEIGHASRLAQLVEARELIRAFLVNRSDREVRTRLNTLAQSYLRAPQLDPCGSLTFRRDDASSWPIGPAVEALFLHGLSDAGARLKACAAPDCHYVFYDYSRSRTGTWCDMNICGARHKMRKHRGRRIADIDERMSQVDP
jgi:predicted RNA-binding Zn ribbon-like protein